jgi:hypothetical protein
LATGCPLTETVGCTGTQMVGGPVHIGDPPERSAVAWHPTRTSACYGLSVGIRTDDRFTHERAVRCLPPGSRPTSAERVHRLYSLVLGDERAGSIYDGHVRIGEAVGLDTLSDDQVETVLGFAMVLSRGRAVVSACDVSVGRAGSRGTPGLCSSLATAGA